MMEPEKECIDKAAEYTTVPSSSDDTLEGEATVPGRSEDTLEVETTVRGSSEDVRGSSEDALEGETSFTLLTNNVNEDINLSSLADVSDNLTVTVDGANLDQSMKVEGITSGQQSLLPAGLPDNLVLVETPKGLILSMADGSADGISFSNTCIATVADEQGRPIITTSLPAGMFSQIPHVDHVMNGVYENEPDQSSGTTTTIFPDTGDTSSQPQYSDSGSQPQYIIAGGGPEQNKKKKGGGGWPKGKKRKLTPEVEAPKKPKTGYVIFALKRRQEIKLTNPELQFPEVTKMLGQEWSNLSQEKKEMYMKLADDDKQRYISEMHEFQNSELYRAFVKNRKINGEPIQGLTDSDSQLLDLEESTGMNELYCKMCDQYFISIHNKKEHMFGKSHLQNITNEIQKDIQQQADIQKQQMLMATAVINAPELRQDGVDMTSVSAADNNHTSKPVDINSFIQEFVRRNEDREREIQLLRKCRQNYEEDNMDINRQLKELEQYESKLDHDLGNMKAYGASLSAQIDALKMVPTLFGVINF